MRHAPAQLRHGFTLIELLVVMTILVILLLVALPVFNYVTGARSTESGLNIAAAMIGRARALALSRSDNKHIGVLFYYEPDSDRDAMQIVEVEAGDSASPLERYFGWQGPGLSSAVPSSPATYQQLNTSPTDARPPDVVYSVSIDQMSDTAIAFKNRPVTRRYVCKTTNQASAANRPPGSSSNFENAWWAAVEVGNTIPVVLDAEVQYLPRGVRTRVLKLKGQRTVGELNGQPGGIILFDKQGRLVQRKWGIAATNKGGAVAVDGGEKLLEAMGINTDLPVTDERTSGVAIAVFNDADVIANDPKNVTQVDDWVINPAGGANQYTVSTQSGELVGGPTQ